MQRWEEMSLHEKNQCILWDLYKNVYGYRPRNVYSEVQWNDPVFVENEIERLTQLMEVF